MTYVNLTEAARLANIGRTTLYRRIKNGDISVVTQRDGSKAIDIAELNRVFDLEQRETLEDVRTSAPRNVAIEHPENNQLIDELRAQIRILTRQLERSEQREDELIGLLKTKLLTAPKKGKRKK